MDGWRNLLRRTSVDFNERNGTSDERGGTTTRAAIVTSAHEQSGLIVIVTKRGRGLNVGVVVEALERNRESACPRGLSARMDAAVCSLLPLDPIIRDPPTTLRPTDQNRCDYFVERVRERRPQSLKKGDKRPKRIAPKKTMILIPKSKAQSPLVRCPTGAFKGQCRNRILRTVVSRRGGKPKNVIIIVSREGWDRCRLGGVIHLTCTFSCVVQMNKF